MDSLAVFMRQTYMPKPDSRITVKEIYEDFRAWMIGKYGAAAWNSIPQRQVYSSLKQFPDYAYVRYREGYCLKGITYKQETVQINISPIRPTLMLNVLPPTETKIERVPEPVPERVTERVPPRVLQVTVPRAFQSVETI